MNLFEKLNRLDDNKSLAESTKMVTKKKLTEGYRVEPKSSEFNVGDKVAERYNDSEFNVGTIIEIKKDAEGTQYLVKWDYSDRDDEEWLYGDVLSLWVEDETEDAHDDNIDEMLTESTEQYELSTLVKDSINHLVNDLSKDPMADDFEDDVCADLENNYDIYVPQNPVKYADWCDAVMNEVSRQLNKDEELTENRHSHYSAPYGYKDAAKVLNRKAPEYYYQRDEIQMAEGDGIKLARYALKKGLPVMIYKYSDPDYPEFAIRGEYHWDDYFYFDPTPHEEDFIAWDGKMLVEESFIEGASEIYYLELFSKDGRTFEQSFSTYQEAEEEGTFSLENNPMTKEYIIYDKNHKCIKHKR